MNDNWYKAAFRYLGGVPERSCVVDLETNGLQVDSDEVLITQAAFAVVDGGAITAAESWLLNWSMPGSGVDPEWFQESLERTEREMANRGKTCKTPWSRVAAEGEHPFDVLATLRGIMGDAIAEGYTFVAHNGFAFDFPILGRHYRYLGDPLEVDAEMLVDTGLLEKARRMGWTPPHPGECPRRNWYREISKAFARGVKWNLDNACTTEYQLAADGFDVSQAHDAAADCVLTHRLLEAMVARANTAAVA